MNIDIAYRLSKLRRDKGYSQEKLAEELGVSRQAVSKWERAESSPDTDNLIALAGLYGMSLDELLKGEAEEKAAKGEAEDEAADYAPAADSAPGMSPDEDSTARSDASASDSPAAAPDPESSKEGADRVNFNLHDGIHMHSHDGADVKVGWGGIYVNDPQSNSHVNIGPGGIHVEDGEGTNIHGDPAGGYTVNGTHYDTWKGAHEAVHWCNGEMECSSRKGWMMRFPYGVIALVAFLCMGIFMGMWGQGLLVLLSTGIWMTIAGVVDVYTSRKSARKRREAITSLVGTCFLFAFFVAGFLFGAWHPGWIFILVGVVACGVINASWHVEAKKN